MGLPMAGMTTQRLLSVGRMHAALRALPVSILPTQTGGAPILVVAPHPDDESLGCGGLIAQACAAGQPVTVLVLTDGTKSHPNSLAYPAARLRRLREAESRQAGRVLGLDSAGIAFLGLPDSHAPRTGEAATRAAQAIAERARAFGAKVIFTTWRHDPHADHLTASILTRQAADLLGLALYEYPVWGWTLPPRRLLRAGLPAGFRLDVSAQMAAKRRAIACHRSQLGLVIDDDPEGFTLQPEFVERFTGTYETFIAVR